ncbi:hypothetical protein, partial [Aeromonas caviae]|uniref:hypothetical protein n=1 Tax=Aeromonas caviae TaxID=648 RepID=UPI001CC48A2F
LIENLTDEEKTELQSYIETERQAAEKRSRQYSAKSAACRSVSMYDCSSVFSSSVRFSIRPSDGS